MRITPLLIAALLLAGCSSTGKHEPTLALMGKSYALPDSSKHKTYYLRVFNAAGDFTNDLEYQTHADYARALLLLKGLTELEKSEADLFVTVRITRAPANSITTDRIAPTARVTGGSTSMVQQTTYTPAGPVRSQGTITTPLTTEYETRIVHDTTVYQVGMIEMIAMDQRFYNEHPDLPTAERMKQVWKTSIGYSYDLPLIIPEAFFFPRLLKFCASKIGVQTGEWTEVVTLTKLLDTPL